MQGDWKDGGAESHEKLDFDWVWVDKAFKRNSIDETIKYTLWVTYCKRGTKG